MSSGFVPLPLMRLILSRLCSGVRTSAKARLLRGSECGWDAHRRRRGTLNGKLEGQRNLAG